jgi:DNA polymerase III delta prime subunit
MTLDQDTISAQLDLLAAHRRTLAVLLQQQALLGGRAYATPGIINGIAEAQSSIQRIKEQLRANGVPVEDEPNDDVQPAVVAAPSNISPQEHRNRRAMLAKVKTIWIEGLLEQSLAKELRIALDLTEQPEAVDLPLNAIVQELNRPSRPLPAGTPIVEIFDQMNGVLLILGAPGGGKTTLLLELARDLIARAEQDEGHPIPVVFNLSSWSTKRQQLKDWLVEELNTKYDVPRKLSQAWMDADVVLLLLDGLDEVAAEQRNDCAEAINTYRQAHGLVPLTVCCRVADYEALTTKLRLQGAVLVQTLTQPQVDAYLARVGDKLAGVRVALRHDTELGELLTTPLMLSTTALAYAGRSATDVRVAGMIDERRRHLFDAYIEAMFKRRSKETRYTREQTVKSLAWLAGQIVQHNQTVFYIEWMQPAWLPRQQRTKYDTFVRLIFGLVFGLLGGLLGGLVFGLVWGLVFGLGFGIDYGGRAVFQHYTLRWLLYRNGSLPFRDLVPFLDYCAERIFLRKVGGGYIFVHRLLMEHFASLYTEQSNDEKRV